MSAGKEPSAAVVALVRDIDVRDPVGLSVPVPPSHARAQAAALGLIKGRKMKVGHRKIYSLTAKGHALVLLERQLESGDQAHDEGCAVHETKRWSPTGCRRCAAWITLTGTDGPAQVVGRVAS